MTDPIRARPAADELTGPFWAFARQGILAVQRCAQCSSWQHPPATRCQRCNAIGGLSFEPVSGEARLVSWTRVHQGLVGGFEQYVPYWNIVVELVEQAGLYMVSDVPPDEGGLANPLKSGARATVHFQRIDDALTLPQFRLTGGEA